MFIISEIAGGENMSPGDIDEIFDAISYCKGASIINMLYHWRGENNFREGMKLYLQQFSGRAASTSQLWQALEDSSR